MSRSSASPGKDDGYRGILNTFENGGDVEKTPGIQTMIDHLNNGDLSSDAVKFLDVSFPKEFFCGTGATNDSEGALSTWKFCLLSLSLRYLDELGICSINPAQHHAT